MYYKFSRYFRRSLFYFNISQQIKITRNANYLIDMKTIFVKKISCYSFQINEAYKKKKKGNSDEMGNLGIFPKSFEKPLNTWNSFTHCIKNIFFQTRLTTGDSTKVEIY